MAKYLFHRRKTAIIFTDIAIFSVGLSVWGVYSFQYHWSFGIVTSILLVLASVHFFIENRISRYIFSIGFSIIYGLLFYVIGYQTDKENPTTPGLVLGILAFLVALWLHKDHFEFLKSAKAIEYNRY